MTATRQKTPGEIVAQLEKLEYRRAKLRRDIATERGRLASIVKRRQAAETAGRAQAGGLGLELEHDSAAWLADADERMKELLKQVWEVEGPGHVGQDDVRPGDLVYARGLGWQFVLDVLPCGVFFEPPNEYAYRTGPYRYESIVDLVRPREKSEAADQGGDGAATGGPDGGMGR